MIRGTIEELIKTVQDSATKIDVAEWIKRKGRRKENTKKSNLDIPVFLFLLNGSKENEEQSIFQDKKLFKTRLTSSQISSAVASFRSWVLALFPPPKPEKKYGWLSKKMKLTV